MKPVFGWKNVTRLNNLAIRMTQDQLAGGSDFLSI